MGRVINVAWSPPGRDFDDLLRENEDAGIIAGIFASAQSPRKAIEIMAEAESQARDSDRQKKSSGRKAAPLKAAAKIHNGADLPGASSPDPAAAVADVDLAASSQTGGLSEATDQRVEGGKNGDDLDLRLAWLPQTDLGNAERFVARHEGRFLWSVALGWLFWDGRRWARDGAEEQRRKAEHATVRAIQREAKAAQAAGHEDLAKSLAKWGRTSEQSGKISGLEKHSAPYLYVEPAALDADPWKINVLNGTLVTKKTAGSDYVTFKPHDPADRITKLAPIVFDPNALCPRYDAFLDLVQPKTEVRRFLHQWGGLSLTGDISEQKLVFFWGKGKNGKSTLLSIWCHVAGDYSRTVPIETFVNEGRSRNAGQATPDLAMLQGRRMVVASEPDRGAKLSEALIKLITGGDVTPVRHLNREYFDLIPQFKLVMSGNYRPRVEGADEGIWRRIGLVPWTVTVPEELRDKLLPEKLKAEASGILNRLLDGLRDWLDSGLIAPEDVLKATADYRRDSDPLGRFLDACVAPDAGGRVQSSELHAVFCAWAKANGATEWSNKGLSNALKERGFESHHSNVNWWLNVKLLKSVNDFVDHEGRPLRQKKDGSGPDGATDNPGNGDEPSF